VPDAPVRDNRAVSEVRAGIVVTGTEVLSATITDRNGPWISQALAAEGVDVAHIEIVGDRPEDMEAALGFLRSQGVDLIVTSGGLGPTADDLTAEVVARFAGRELRLDEEMEAKIGKIIERFAARMKFEPGPLKEANRKQAMVPEGATAIDPAGTAPGLVVPAGDQTVIVLPGPPRELKAMWDQVLATPPVPEVLERAGRFETFSLKLFGIPESELAESLREIGEESDLSPLEITTCLRRGELHIDVRNRPGPEATEAAEALRRGIEEHHGRYLWAQEGESIEEVVGTLLEGRKIAVAESCTGGLLAVRMTDRPGASGVFAGGVVAYANEAKTDLLGVPAEMIAEYGAVSDEVAEAMADGAIERFGAHVGCSTTGVAGPDGGTEEKPVGTVCICAKLAGGRKIARRIVLPGDRADIRDRTSTLSLHLLRYLLRDEEPPR
jgi:competence/damage-inducible protein CinA-like protein